ncbi:MAG TPA: hypothetical protein DCS93_14280 [Microscillaceae bacterium]|nr:hypothetical protein [Microscillaceae bacterium]
MFRFDKIYVGWSAQRLARHVIYWACWMMFFASINSSYKKYDEGFWFWINVELWAMTVKLPFTYLVIYGLVPRYLIKKQYSTFMVGALVLAIVSGIGITLVHHFITEMSVLKAPTATWWDLAGIGYKTLDLIYVASLPTAFKLTQRYIQQEKNTRQIIEEKLGTELQLLKNQLQPHFLFNTLNNLYGMVLTKDEKTADVVLRLSEIISYMLYECDQPKIALSKEVEHLKNYIALEKIRHGKRLLITLETKGMEGNQRIAPLLLLPFVENAFKHGVANHEQAAWIRINVWSNGEQLEFMVENGLATDTLDNEAATLVKHSGIGLENVKKRLQLLYPDQHELIIRQQDSFFVKLILQIG